MGDLIGRRLGRYRIVEQIGEGGMGVVYRAHDERLERDVAIKVLPEEVAFDPDRLARFEREAKAVAQLDHPNILAIHDFGSEDGVAFAVMELLEGESLREVIKRAELSHGKAVDYARSIADGLGAAHTKGIVHRDLKPENVFLTKDGRVKILDFGLAKLQLPEQDLATETPTATLETKPGQLLGTVAYMAPEQVQGKPADQRSDLFALGVMLYEMLTGQRPFGGSTTVETAAAILKEDPEAISLASPGVSPTLAGVVSKCLEKRPEDRFSSAHDLSLTLDTIDSGAIAPEVSSGSVLQRRWPHILAVVIAAIVAMLVVLPPEGLFQKPGDVPQPPALPRIVVLPFENLGSPEDEYFAEGMTEEITARLATVEGMQVISRTSARQYAGTEKTVPEIGDELDVGYVLEGTVRWARSEDGGSRIRTTLQLIRTEDDTHLWADTYDRLLDDVFEVQSEIAQIVAEALGVTIGGGEKGLVDATPTDNIDAYQAFLRGRYWISRPHFTYDNWERAMQGFQRAVDLDPGFARAHAELARGHALVRYFRHDLTPERLEAADSAAQRALELAPGNPHAAGELAGSAEVFDAMSDMYIVEGRWEDALDASRRGVELSPRDADLVSQTAWILLTLRRYRDALTTSDHAIQLAPDAFWPYFYKVLTLWSWRGDPTETRSILDGLTATAGGWERWTWFWQEMYAGRYHEALARLESASEGWIRIKMWARPNTLLAAYVYEKLGDTDGATAAYETARELLEAETAASPEDPRMHSSLGIVYAIQGRSEDAVREGQLACDLLPMSKDGFYYLPYVIDLAHIYTILGANEAALGLLEHLLDNPSWISAPFLKMDPRWDPLRDDPAFAALLEKYAID
jgi:serine/threonine-protein kinase